MRYFLTISVAVSVAIVVCFVLTLNLEAKSFLYLAGTTVAPTYTIYDWDTGYFYDMINDYHLGWYSEDFEIIGKRPKDGYR